MAQRDVKLYLSLKKAIKEKVANPSLDFNLLEVDGARRAYDYDYIFQIARRVFPQKYNLGHSYWVHGSSRLPISNLDKEQLAQLNMEYARDIVKGWGGTDETQINQKELDPVLVEYESELTAPEEPDYFHKTELPQHALPEQPQQEKATQQNQEPPASQPIHREPPHPQRPLQRPSLPQETQEKLNKASQSMQQTQRQISKRFPNSPQPSERMSGRLNSATRVIRPRLSQPSIPRSKVSAPRPVRIGSQNRRNKKRFIPPIRPIAGGSGFSLPWVPKFLTNAARSLLRGAANLGRSLIRGAFNFGSRALGQLLPRLGWQAGATAARSLAFSAGGTAAAIITSAAFWWTIGIIGLFVFAWWYDNMLGNSQCDKPGQMEVKKVLENPRSGQDNVNNGDRIDYQIQTTYIWLCQATTLPSITVTDKIPLSLEYVDGTAKSESGANGPGPDGVYNPDTRTLIWTINNVSSNDPIAFSFSVMPFEQADSTWSVQDTWLQNQATVRYFEPVNRGAETVPGGGGELPTQDNCNGKYQLNNPIGNYGDPSCNFTEDSLYTLLQQQDPANANYRFDVVVKCESSYNPNAHADHGIVGTPDVEGAWGLFQMGRGKNGQYDHGDVAWQTQTSNAVNYNNNLARKWRYWACARDRW